LPDLSGVFAPENQAIQYRDGNMACEIERKFLISSMDWHRQVDHGCSIRQAYLVSNSSVSVRIRIKKSDHATLTIKSRPGELTRQEFEYEIPVKDAVALLRMRSGGIIEKVRYEVPCGNLKWEIDVFQGDNEGLIIAEIELEHEEQLFDRPHWLGEEISADDRYYNASLAVRPFNLWDRTSGPSAPGA
jgi:adenylate cyclase